MNFVLLSVILFQSILCDEELNMPSLNPGEDGDSSGRR